MIESSKTINLKVDKYILHHAISQGFCNIFYYFALYDISDQVQIGVDSYGHFFQNIDMRPSNLELIGVVER